MPASVARLPAAPPPMPSPQLVPAALPSPPPPPPPIPRRSSRSRLHLSAHRDDPPIPPRLVGSPLLHRLTTMPHTPYIISEKAHSELWLDGDEFGAKRKETAHLRDIPLPPPLLSPSATPSKRTARRSPPISPTARGRAGSRSPPPSPRWPSPPPPVPPIPSSAFATPGAKRSTVHLSAQSPSQSNIPDLSLASPSFSHKDHSAPRQLTA